MGGEVVGMIHLKCCWTGRCGKVYAVDADKFLSELTHLAVKGQGSFQYPVRDCPFCQKPLSAPTTGGESK